MTMKINIVDVLPGEVETKIRQFKYKDLRCGAIFAFHADDPLLRQKTDAGHVVLSCGEHYKASQCGNLEETPVILYDVEIYARKIK